MKIVSKFFAAALALTGFCLHATNVGEPFPDLNKYNLEGSLPDLKDKIVLVDFFASWCVPCRQSFPVMQELQARYKEKGFVIVAIDLDKKKEDMENFLKRVRNNLPVVRDASAKLVADVRVPTMPTSFLIDKNGKIAAIHAGFHGDETKAKYVSEIEGLLK